MKIDFSDIRLLQKTAAPFRPAAFLFYHNKSWHFKQSEGWRVLIQVVSLSLLFKDADAVRGQLCVITRWMMPVRAAFWSRASQSGIDGALQLPCCCVLMEISQAARKSVRDSLACRCDLDWTCECEHSLRSCYFNVESMKATFRWQMPPCQHWCPFRWPSFRAVGTECFRRSQKGSRLQI